ncbi:MAG: hypothetical protein APF84_10145 [Gracilibacter sp. BRH_c7a]|nr:MAG: hypothetical protein APF84_10145 [Gracilibacter sp. BRH_c7a]
MKRMRDIVRLPVLKLQTGEHLGWVKDILFDEKKCIVTGIILEKDSFLTPHTQIISRDDIVACAKDSLNVKEFTNEKVNGSLWSHKIGNKVYNDQGEQIGTVGDIFVDNTFKDITGYEISDGLFADLFDGRGAILEKNIIADGKDVIIVEGGSL